MIILEGQQGIGKSAALRIIGGEYFTEQHESATGKGFFEVLQGKLLVEISELDSFNRAEVTRVKQVVTCTSDRYRDPYSHRATDHPRQCVFVGTTNSDSWNRDESGARRFWPIACSGEVDLNEIRTSRDQCFAEAVHRYKAGESWWTMPLEDTRTEQESRYEEDAWSEPIWKYLGPRSQVTVFEILTECLQIDEGDIQKADQMRVATCLKRLQWRRGKLERFGEGRVRFWRPNDEK